MKRFIISLSILCFGVHTAIADETPLEAHFTAQEASVPYYKMGWDSPDEAATWTYSGVASGYLSWHLEENTPYIGQPAFSSIDPDNKYSLCVRYGTSAQNEVATSPTIAILPNTTLEFYACFRSVYLVFFPTKTKEMLEGRYERARTAKSMFFLSSIEPTLNMYCSGR